MSRSGAEELAEIVQLGLDTRGREGIEFEPCDVSVEIVDSLPGGRRFLWLERPDAVQLLVSTGEMSAAGAQQLAAILSDRMIVEERAPTAAPLLDDSVIPPSATAGAVPPAPSQ